jgi:hypothetical protein
LTWSYFSQPVNLLNQITTQNETGPNPLFSGPLSQRIFPALPAYKNTFGPSVGFAYSPQWGGFLTGSGKTVIRGGFRLSYDPPNLNIFTNNYDSAPSTLAATLVPSGANPLNVPLNPLGFTVQALLNQPSLRGQIPQNFPQALLPSNFRPDNVKSWTLGVQRELGKNSALEVRYVGNHASDLFQNVNANPFIGTATRPGLQQLFPNLVPAGVTACTTPGFAFGRVNCNEGLVQLRSNGGYSNYNALQANYRATNLFHQLTMTASYTFSKTLDNSGEIFNTFGAGNTTALSQNPFNTSGGEYSLSGLDFPSTFSIQLTEQLPFFKEQHGLLGRVLGGWSGAINYIYSSGQNYTPFELFYADLTNQLNGANPFDSAFEPAFNNGVGNARPFLANPNAPANAVGIFEGDACNLASIGVLPGAACTGPGGTPGPNNQLLSLNALNAKTPAAQVVTNQQVHFIANTAAAEQVFGTPFGNVPRNALRDSPINVGNISIYKNIKLREHYSFEFHATMLNAFNHSNFAGVVPFVENAGLPVASGNGFALPNHDTDQANGLTNEIPGQNLSATRRIYFGGTFRF